MKRNQCLTIITTMALLTWTVATAAWADEAAQASQILKRSGVQGGLVVHIGCGDGKLTSAFAANDAYLVHGLDTNAEDVTAAREHVRSADRYGRVSVAQFDGRRLPYVDNLVNLIVADSLGDVTRDEVMRVLAPLGVACVKQDGLWRKIVKPWPEEIDEWTHFLHGADNNAVAADSVVGPPKRYQWIAGPKWARGHDHLSSLSAMVSAKGRIFCILDEAPAASIAFEPEWRLVARDAFSGVLLWKRTIGPWEGHFRPFRTGPAGLAKRLVAVGDRVYVTLGYGKPVTILDAATGQTIRECQQTANAMEIAFSDGVLFAVVGDHAPYAPEDTGKLSIEMKESGKTSGAPEPHWKVWREKAPLKRLVAVHAETGRLLWKKDDASTRQIMPTAMAVSDGRVFFQNEKALVALDATTGDVLWQAARAVNGDAPGSSAPTLVASGGVVICADREIGQASQEKDELGRSVQWHLYPHTAHSKHGQAIAYDAATGKRLWSVTSVENFRSPADVFVVGDKAIVRSNKPGMNAKIDLRTGIATQVSDQKSPIRDPGTHWRCYRNKATEKYLLLCQRWTEFYDHTTGVQTVSNFVRGSCQYGQMPCNGLLYTPHHSCACSIESDLSSFNALAPNANPTEDIPGAVRLEKGPAYGSVSSQRTTIVAADDWPTYRHDAARSGVASTQVDAALTRVWETRLDGPLTAPVVADGMLITAAPESHAVHALDAESGKAVWSFTAGGSVDSPPTIYQGTVIFGSADGWVYCLQAADGQLAWRHRTAPIDRRIVAYGKIESVWPLHGSVLVHEGVVYTAAGRTTAMDGLFFCALDAATGQLLTEKRITAASFADILSSDGTNIFMRQLRLDRQGSVLPGDVPHLFSPAGFLDDTWWHRTYWQFGTRMPGGYTQWFSAGELLPAGRLMVMDDKRIYGFGRLNQYSHVGSHLGLGKTHYLLYAADRSDFPADVQPAIKRRVSWSARKPDIPTVWKSKIDLLARGMVLCDKVLFVVGPPDLFDTEQSNDPYPYAPASAESLRSQREAMEGLQGSTLRAISADSGKQLSETKLDGLPAWDGLIAVGGRLYLTMRDGAVRCFSGG